MVPVRELAAVEMTLSNSGHDRIGSKNLSGIEKLLATYPRTRPPLPEAYAKIYESEYKLNRNGTTPITRLAQLAEGWMHRQVARSNGIGRVLEIGAGTLNHLPYEPCEKLTGYDIVEPFTPLFHANPCLNRVQNIYKDIVSIPSDQLYDRIISIAVLEHLEDLPLVIARGALLLHADGTFQHAIPTEGGLAWELAWRLSTGLSFRMRRGLSYAVLMRHEHINAAHEILGLMNYFFRSVKIRRFPFSMPSASLYTYIQATHPEERRCREYLHDAANRKKT